MRLFRFRSENLWRESSRRILLERLGDRLIFRFHLEYIRISTFFILEFASLFLDNNNLTYHDARFKLSLNSLKSFSKNRPSLEREATKREAKNEKHHAHRITIKIIIHIVLECRKDNPMRPMKNSVLQIRRGG